MYQIEIYWPIRHNLWTFELYHQPHTCHPTTLYIILNALAHISSTIHYFDPDKINVWTSSLKHQMIQIASTNSVPAAETNGPKTKGKILKNLGGLGGGAESPKDKQDGVPMANTNKKNSIKSKNMVSLKVTQRLNTALAWYANSKLAIDTNNLFFFVA